MLSSASADAERGDDLARQRPQAGVHDRRVLALEQPDPPELVREAERRAGHLLREQLGGLALELGVDRREHGRDRDRAQLLGADVGGDPLQLGPVQRRDRAPVDLVPAVGDVPVPAERVAQVVGPVDHRRQRGRGRRGQPHARRRDQAPPLDDRVGEVRGADHHRGHARGVQARRQLAQRRADAAGDVGGCRRLDVGEHAPPVDDDRVGVGPAYVDADVHAVSCLLKSAGVRQPPSIGSVAPVTMSNAGPHSIATSSATSSRVTSRPAGVCAIARSTKLASNAAMSSALSAICPGATALTVISGRVRAPAPRSGTRRPAWPARRSSGYAAPPSLPRAARSAPSRRRASPARRV